MKSKEVREMTIDELQKQLVSLKEELFNLRFQLATGQLDNPMRVRDVRKSIARVKTVLHEHELKAGQA
ncbi:MAG: 50S ribosomal protein L29 [Firmicutes bacterium]|jgi:large subunit ribosomal protein L29|nr:50S ribosomal protein L29 [Bacillota bacterium]